MGIREDLRYALAIARRPVVRVVAPEVHKRIRRALDALDAIDAHDLKLQNADKAADCFDYAEVLDLLNYNA